MSEEKKCLKCGIELPPDAPGGHCPHCLLQLGLGIENMVVVSIIEKSGDRIGRYKLLQQIGEGGCGIVYMAEQDEPIRRRVALKIIKLGMDTKTVIARFEAERQALALMDHPNIAKVFDAGATDTGRPHFVMELVRGIKITDYCDAQKLSIRQRLNLFIQVCQAIQHAHQKGVIHRDIKPSNVLVTEQDGVAVPKIIDFGIAKATTDQRLTDKTLFTAFEQFIGTPAYMSPEQAGLGGLDIDTRSDIYSLGVLLYELLTGHQPFDSAELHRAALNEILRTLRDKEPPRPSARLTTLTEQELTLTAERHQAAPAKLSSLLRGDLDWIVMKALDKDRRHRYETANGFAADILRHLNNEPIVARPPSVAYRLQKSFRRNKLVFAAMAAVAVALLVGISASVWQAVRATRAEHQEKWLRVAAQQAEADQAKEKAAAQQSLYNSLVDAARATRLARRVGYREEVFKLLQQARVLQVPQKNLADLRREAVACLGDFVGLSPTTFTDFTTDREIVKAELSSSGRQAAFEWGDGRIQLRELPSGREIARLSGTNGFFHDFCFNSTDDQFFALFRPATGNLNQDTAESRLYAWSRGTNGGWQEAGNKLVPGADRLLPTGAGVFAVANDFGWFNTNNPESTFAKFRLLDLKTRALVPGYDVTNALPGRWSWWWNTTADGRFLAVESEDTQTPVSSAVVNLYDFKASRQINRLPLPMYGPMNLSPDGKYLACLSAAGGAIYKVPGLERVGEFKEYFLNPAVFYRDKVVLPVEHQSSIRFLNLATREDMAMVNEEEPAWPVAVSADENSLLTVGAHHARLYQLTTPEKLELPIHADAVTAAAFSPDGTCLASVSKDHVVRVCDAMTGRIFWQTNDLPGSGQSLSYSPDGHWLVTGDWQTDRVWIWDANTGKRLLEFGADRAGQTISAQFSPDGRYLATSATSGKNGINIWTLERGSTEGDLEVKLLKTLPMYAESLMFSPDNRYLAFENENIYLWDFNHSDQPHRVTTNTLMGIQSESFTPDSGCLLMMDSKREVVTLDVATGKTTSTFQTGEPKVAQEWVHNFCLSPDGSKLALATQSMLGVEIWDTKTGKWLYSLPEESGSVYWLAWSPDSQRLAVSRDNGNIAIWNLATVNQIMTQLKLAP
jgi:serine/threonine protein kinase/WD40 repeat protein